jgi:hypothetical protein
VQLDRARQVVRGNALFGCFDALRFQNKMH